MDLCLPGGHIPGGHIVLSQSAEKHRVCKIGDFSPFDNDNTNGLGESSDDDIRRLWGVEKEGAESGHTKEPLERILNKS